MRIDKGIPHTREHKSTSPHHPLRRRRAGELQPDDPWYVTDEQARLIKLAAEQPKPDKNLVVQDVDERQWREELRKDQTDLARYFVINLHDDSLLVNGQEVRTGEIAGPLPNFAIFECPGGQIVFWWGVNGRDHGTSDAARDWSEEWEKLREIQGWENVALKAGEVWSEKVKAKRQREREDEDDSDDDLWELWKRGELAKAK